MKPRQLIATAAVPGAEPLRRHCQNKIRRRSICLWSARRDRSGTEDFRRSREAIFYANRAFTNQTGLI